MSPRCSKVLRQSAAVLCVSAALFAVVQNAAAVTVPDLYEISLPVGGNRDAAFGDALKAVVVRVSGRRDAAVRLGPALNNPRQYAQRFGVSSDNMLEVGFDSVSVDKLLTGAGLPVWGRERPQTLVLLNIQAPDGSSYWIDNNANATDRDAVARAAKQRGLPIVWADMDSQDRNQVETRAPAALLQVAARYNANAALLGMAHRDATGGFAVHWTLAAEDGQSESNGSIEDGVHLAADTFSRIYSASGSSLDSVALEISGIGNLGSYAGTLNYLEAMTVVSTVALERVSGDTMHFRLAVRGDAAMLRRALALDGKLIPVTPADGSASPADRLQFRYQP